MPLSHRGTRPLGTARTRALRALLPALLAACGGGSDAGPTDPVTPPAGPSVTIASVTSLPLGLGTTLAATVRDASGAVVPAAAVTWSVNDTTRATIDADGLLFSRALGPVTVTASSGGLSATATITVGAAPATTACRLPRSTGSVALGFPRAASRLPSTGTVRMTVLFVDFPDAVATRTPESVFALLSPGAQERFAAFSFGRMNAILLPRLQWLRMSQNASAYGFLDGLSFAEHRAFLQEAVNLADAGTNFAETDAVIVIANPDASAISYGPAFVPGAGSGLTADGREILSGTNSGADLLGWGGAGWLVHELGHTLGLPDLYDYAGGSIHRHVGQWSQMGLISGAGAEWTGFERWMLGWLDDAQVACMPSGNYTVPIAPLVGGGERKLIVVPLTTTRAIAIESRRARGYDAAIPREGLLVYALDASVASGAGTMRVLPEADTDASKLLRTLTPGQSLTYSGVTVTFVSRDGERELVRIQR